VQVISIGVSTFVSTELLLSLTEHFKKEVTKKYRLNLLFEIILKHHRSHKKTQGPRVWVPCLHRLCLRNARQAERGKMRLCFT